MNNTELINKYFKPFIWTGFLYVDGGWGDKTRISNELLRNNPLLSNKLTPIFCSPIADTIYIEEIPGQSPNNQINQRYEVVLMGSAFKDLEKFMKTLSTILKEDAVWVLESINPEKKNRDLFKSVIKQSKDKEPMFTIYKGKPSVDFSSPLQISSW